MTKEEIFALIRFFDVFKEVPDNQLQWLAENGKVQVFEEGDPFLRPGDPIDNIMIILTGAFKIFAINGNQEREMAEKVAGEVSGFLPFSRARVALGTSRVTERSKILCLHRSFEREMLKDHYELCQVLVHEMTSRVREFTNIQKQTEKMAALGKLSAGLAHELNNPASAIVRSSLELKKHLSLQPDKFKKVIKVQVTDDAIDEINAMLFEKINNPPPHKSLMVKKRSEDDVGLLLESLDVDDSFELAENLVEFGFEKKDIEYISNFVEKKDIGHILHWVGDNLMIEKMVNDIQESSERISKLVKSVKIYTHMDQSQEKMLGDLHEGILNTLNILNHKIKNSRIDVQLLFDQHIPPILLYVGEMNQVWTNLLDNAIDAISEVENPKIVIQTSKIGKEVKVCINDNGRGIPEEMIARIWEPFYTTKDIGKGTGLGLEMVKNIIDRIQGNIKVKSQPGNTTFEVRFPI